MKRIRIFFWTVCGTSIAITLLLWLWFSYGAPPAGHSADECISLYQSNMRTPLFSGFLTMGSFLIAMKTGILTRLKEAYESPDYESRYRAFRVKNPSARYFESLETLSRALGWNVRFCLLASGFQMSLGFIWHPLALALCIGLALSSLIFLLYLTGILMKAHEDWFRKIEEAIQDKLKLNDGIQDSELEKHLSKKKP